MSNTIKKGTWVSLRKTILESKDRAAGIPESTAATPLIMWVSGFLENDAEMGKEATIRTKMNRTESGVVEVINPTTDVDYGDYIPEIAQIGAQARQILWGEN